MDDKEHARLTSRPGTSLAEIRFLTEQLFCELERSMVGTAEDRDALLASSGEQLEFLAPILIYLTHLPGEPDRSRNVCSLTFDFLPEAWEEERDERGRVLRKRKEPTPGTAPAAWLALELARALNFYLVGWFIDRYYLFRACGLVFCNSYVYIKILTETDRTRREMFVKTNTAARMGRRY
jgi:hypothetical protein